MRRDELYLRDIIEAAHNIAEDIAGMGREDFLGNRTVRDAVVRNQARTAACRKTSERFLRPRNQRHVINPDRPRNLAVEFPGLPPECSNL